MKKVLIYTDGACSGNPGPGGWGAILMYGEVKKEISMFQDVNIKNNLAEKLRNDEVKISDLTDLEIEEMTEFFKKDIAEVDREIERIKMNILRMKEKLQNNTGIL